MLNSIGLQNIGIERFLADVLPGLAELPGKIIVNLFGYELDDYPRLAERVESAAGIAAVELNVSCPNVKQGGIEFGHDPEVLERPGSGGTGRHFEADDRQALAQRRPPLASSARRRKPAAPTSFRRSTPCSAWRSIPGRGAAASHTGRGGSVGPGDPADRAYAWSTMSRAGSACR